MPKATTKRDWKSGLQHFSSKWKKTFLKRRMQIEDRWRPSVISCISQEEYYQAYQADRTTWSRLEMEFMEEMCVANSVDPQVLFSFVQRLQPARFLEIGTFRGGTAAAVKMVSPATEVFTINHPSPEKLPANSLERDQVGIAFRRRGLDVKLLWADSTDLHQLHIPLCDMIFVDGDHSRAAVIRDLENCWLRLKPGGHMLFHDFIPPGTPQRPFHTRCVASAYRQFSRTHKEEFDEAFHVIGSWIGCVRKRIDQQSSRRVAA
jgi:predicted O-methyltransferase YrrM